jgi:WhiB family redox-sensing transcriptional regulator
MTRDRDWTEHAACKDAPPALFYPVESWSRLTLTTNNIQRQRDESAYALAYCQRCPVEDECLAWALAVPERWGIWGNTVELERRRMRAAAKTDATHPAGRPVNESTYRKHGCRCGGCVLAHYEANKERRTG